jgi:hypothetical protein
MCGVRGLWCEQRRESQRKGNLLVAVRFSLDAKAGSPQVFPEFLKQSPGPVISGVVPLPFHPRLWPFQRLESDAGMLKYETEARK